MEKIPKPQDPYLLLDVDGTLIDADYQLTYPFLSASVVSLQEQGWWIGLSSDSTLHLMHYWRDQLGLNGALVAEKGAVIENNGELVYDPALEQSFSEINQTAQEMIQQSFPSATFWYGNPVEAIRNQEIPGNPGDTVVLFNTYRQCSFGIFVRYISENGAIIDNQLTSDVVESIKPLYNAATFNEDFSYEHGLLIVSQATTNKRLGTMTLMDALGLSQIGMVGNSMADYIGSDIAKHYAVNNACQNFKDVADYTAAHPLTEGVDEIIRQLAVAG